ncbi:HlyD family secretion protein [Fischerella thermalis BR2B]|jgi:HlyD family secretion protein|uniref:HlyD family secretion protein n=1 Tax=Fischerella thermalis TaxID=372787 RepID=UPI0002FAF9B0|nr:HlyD family efflux transporter periplasmic adaptor subunit [Fischerella thermalis]PMB30671.1 HlyD family secretion protein [Fischerella thermalis CCMEE 5208]PMB32022.1 HlyD family secretion protein [Fischerella thermalis BR2B]
MTKIFSPTEPASETSADQLASEQANSVALPKAKLTHRSLLWWLGIAGLTLVTVAIPAWYFGFRSSSPSTVLEVSGRIEGYETDIGTKVPGRVMVVTVREGDRVQVGQVLAKLDDSEIQAQLQAAEARLAAAQQQVNQAQRQINVIQSQIEEAQLNLEQAQEDTRGRITQARSALAAAQAQWQQAQAQQEQAESALNLAQIERDRAMKLHQEGAYSQQQLDQAQTALETAQATLRAQQAAVETARRQVNAAKGDLTSVQTTRLNPNIRQTRLQGLQEQLVIARSQWEAAQATVRQVAAERQRILAQVNDLTITSPIDGIVTARSVEPGTVVSSGKTLLTVINPNTVYLRGFIPEGEIGQIRVGQTAKVYLDSAPEQSLAAHVAAIDTEASFTPENIYFRNDRVEQVFGVKISIATPDGLAKPGMPADAEIELN